MFDLNVPNALTVFRMLLVPVLVAALLSEGPGGDWVAAGIFCVASATDAIDGYLARRHEAITSFGRLMDPLADKLLVTAALVALVSLDRLAAWVAMIIISREFAVTGLRQLAMERGIVMPASQWGKIKTCVQILAIMVLIVVDRSTVWTEVLVYATVLVTVASGIDYVFGLRRSLADLERDRAATLA